MLINDERVEVTEQYSQACTSSNLRVQAEKRSSADILIASGMSSSRIGSALMRLHTKPDRIGLEAVHQQLTHRAKLLNIDRPEVVSASVLSWWLNHVCNACNGVKFEVIQDSPSLSARSCKVCKGSGESKLPHGESGKILLEWVEECKQAWATSIKKRLHPRP